VLDRSRTAALAKASDSNFERSLFRIRKKDYKRGNRIDNYLRKDILGEVLKAFDTKCLNCEGTYDLTLDHFAIPKNEGGNFVLWLVDPGCIKLNVIVLCRGCNASKGEIPSSLFFTPEKLALALHNQETLLAYLLTSEPAGRLIRKWYA